MKEQWKAHLVETGKIDELKKLLRLRLVESGWREKMKVECREIVKMKGADKITVEDLVTGITETGRREVPEAVKKELLDKIRTALQDDDKN